VRILFLSLLLHLALRILSTTVIMAIHRLLHSFYLAAAALLLLAPSLVTAATRTVEARDTCYSGVYTIIARGSEEVQGQSVLDPIAAAISSAIPNSGYNEVVYPALLSFWNSAPQGVTNAQEQMQNYSSACPDGKIVLMGYSQGSYVIQHAVAGGNFSSESWGPIADSIGEKSKWSLSLRKRKYV
jgi:hypothetical protein